jgi:hypothetical protein
MDVITLLEDLIKIESNAENIHIQNFILNQLSDTELDSTHSGTVRLREVHEPTPTLVGIFPVTGAYRGQGHRGWCSGSVRQPGVHLENVPRLRSNRTAKFASGVPMYKRRLPRLGVSSRY